MMSERFDDVAKTVAERAPRRTALLGLGALVLGSFGVAGFGHVAEAKNTNNQCQQCKRQCRNNNQKQGKKHQRTCGNKCRHKCNNKHK